jgi:hypothetical protein
MQFKDGPVVEISSRDYWFKVVDMLQQNWALIDAVQAGRATVFFVDDRSGVFDRMLFETAEDAAQALTRNGFRRFAGDPEAKEIMAPPQAPFVQTVHPNGPVYSSGRYWS